jgi:CDP-diglyceride synthetase
MLRTPVRVSPSTEATLETEAKRTHRPGAVWTLVAMLALVATGLPAGISFMVDPGGAGLGAKLSWLERTPVSDFFLPGLFLSLVYGVGSLLLIVGLVWRPSPGPLHRLDARLGHHWAWVGTIAMGIVLVAWVVYELVVLPETMPLQYVMIGLGLLLVALPSLPSMRGWYAVRM